MAVASRDGQDAIAVTGTRARFALAALLTIAVGLLVHLRGALLGPSARDVLGDALWAMMMFWWIGVIAPRMQRTMRAALAYAVCAAVEVGQLYHAPWIDAVRATRVGHLVLGSGFDPRDLLAYAVGVAVAVLSERTVTARAGYRQQDA